jgi:hypothetical protein
MEKNQIIDEFRKCKEDPIYFMSNYIKVVHPIRGLTDFDLYPFQKRIVSNLKEHRFNVLRKFRQAGCTTIAAAYSLWFCIFNKHKVVVILSKGDSESTEVLDRVKIMYDELPKFLKPGIVEDNKHTLKLSSQSVIKSRPSGKQSGRSLAGSILIIDEAAFIDNIDSIWAAVYPIISTGGRAFILSTVNGVGNWYYTLYQEALAGKNSFNPIDIRWGEHPEYSRQEGYEHIYEQMLEQDPPLEIEKWEEVTKSNMPFKKWLQEYECEFLGTGETYISGEILRQLVEEANDEYYTKYNNKMRVWAEPVPQYDYILSTDVSLGRGRDYSAFHIINAYNGEQVAEFYSNKTPINEFAEIIVKEATLYNTAYTICERNTIGNNLIDWLFTILEYENLWLDDRNNFGFQVTSTNRDQLLAEMEEVIRTNSIKLNSKRTVDELLSFIVTDTGRVTADSGKHDDLIMSLALGIHCYKTIGDTTPIEQTKIPHKEAPLSISKSNKYRIPAYGGYSEEDITWLKK